MERRDALFHVVEQELVDLARGDGLARVEGVEDVVHLLVAERDGGVLRVVVAVFSPPGMAAAAGRCCGLVSHDHAIVVAVVDLREGLVLWSVWLMPPVT